MPTRLRTMDVPLDKITWLLALLILPWTFKFLWAPLVDLLRGPRWGFRHWILATQAVMVTTLLPLLWLDLRNQFPIVAVFLLMHAIAAATQDVAIDALCIRSSDQSERASLNGWMQCGMLVGRALMGGGSLVLEQWLGYQGVVLVLIGLITFSTLLVSFSREQPSDDEGWASPRENPGQRLRALLHRIVMSLRSRVIWIGILFALIGPAAFKSLEAIIGPYLVDHGYDELEIGGFTATFMIGFMIAGSLLAGRIAKRFRARRLVGVALVMNLLAIASLAFTDWALGSRSGIHLLMLLTIVALTVGILTVAMYSWLMNCTQPSLAATQFTLFMACTNACEAWSTTVFGQLQTHVGYPATLGIFCCISAAGLLLLATGSDSAEQELAWDRAENL